MYTSKLNLKNLYLVIFFLSTVVCNSQDKDDKSLQQSDKNIAFAKIDQAPYPDECKALIDIQAESKQCLSEYISQFVGANFRVNKFKNSSPGRYRISVQFTISKDGKVSKVLARAPETAMEEEAIRVIKKLPRMNPGMFEGEYVNVLYGLPINFVVPEKKKK